MTLKVLGDKSSKGRYDPNLASQLNDSISKDVILPRVPKAAPSVPTPESPQDNPVSMQSTRKGFFTAPYMTEAQYKEKCILLPGKDHGNYDYPDMVVSLKLFDPSSFTNAHQDLKDVGATMLTLRQYVDLLGIINENIKGNKPLYDGRGDRLEGEKLHRAVKSFIGEEKMPVTQKERLDGFFTWSQGKTIFNYEHRWTGGNVSPSPISPNYSEPLDPTTETKHRTAGYNLDTWLASATIQGLPPSWCTNVGATLEYNPPQAPVLGGPINPNANSISIDIMSFGIKCLNCQEKNTELIGYRAAWVRRLRTGGLLI